METLEEHVVKIRQWQKDFDLPDAMLPLFVALFKKQNGGNPNHLTRMMRCSPKYHKMTVGVFYELAKVGSTTCNGRELLQRCKELLSATNEALVGANHFPFMKLPLELRQRVYTHYSANLFNNRQVHIRPVMSRFCDCPFHFKILRGPVRVFLSLCRTCKQISDEFLATWFKEKTIFFRCTCELREALANKALRNNVRHILVSWSGECAEEAFRRLREVTALRHVCILVTEDVFRVKSSREQEWAEHFKPRLHRRLTDSCGFDQVIELAQHFGLNKVSVDNAFDGKVSRRSKPSVEALQSYLKSKCEAPKQHLKVPIEVRRVKGRIRS